LEIAGLTKSRKYGSKSFFVWLVGTSWKLLRTCSHASFNAIPKSGRVCEIEVLSLI
jgi:hypothetical protein